MNLKHLPIRLRSWRLRFYLPLVIGALFILALILHYGVNTPNEDEWDLVPLFQKFGHHDLNLSAFWQPHNEHRMFFPMLILFANAYATHWNTIAESLLCLFFAIISAWLLLKMLGPEVRQHSVGPATAGLIAVWFFSPVQWESWLSGLFLEWFTCVTGAVATIYLLERFTQATRPLRRRAAFVGAMLSAVFSTYSLANGMFIWVVGLVMLVVSGNRRRPSVIWAVVGAASIGLYYYHYNERPSGALLHHPLVFIGFLVEFIGGVVGSDKANLQAPGIVGSLLLLALLPLLSLVWQRRAKVRLYLPWLSVILFSVLCDVSVAYGRATNGLSQALAPRYAAFSLLYVIGLIGLGVTLLVSSSNMSARLARIAILGTVVICLPFLASSYNVGIRGLQHDSADLRANRACALRPDPSASCLERTYPSAEIVRPRIEYVKARHWAGY